MKKSVKIIALCLCIAAFGVLFAGCDYIDELRANQAFLSENKETISFRGETYKRLPAGGSLYVSSSYNYMYMYDNVMVTDKDVPVLLSDLYYYYSDYDAKRDIFSVDVTNTAGEYNGYSYAYTYFCNEKDYDMYINAIENNTMDFIGVEYCVSHDNGWYYVLETLSKEVSNEIFGYIQNSNTMSSEVFDEIYYNYESIDGSLYKCDSEGLLAQYFEGFDILRDTKGNIYLTDYNAEKAVKLSEKASKEFKDEYFNGAYIEGTDVIIGGADTATNILLG